MGYKVKNSVVRAFRSVKTIVLTDSAICVH
jgi:hypothetical protein